MVDLQQGIGLMSPYVKTQTDQFNFFQNLLIYTIDFDIKSCVQERVGGQQSDVPMENDHEVSCIGVGRYHLCLSVIDKLYFSN